MVAVPSVMPNYQTLEGMKKCIFLKICTILVLEFDFAFRTIFNWVLNFIPQIVYTLPVEGKLLLGLGDVCIGPLLYVMLDFFFMLM